MESQRTLPTYEDRDGYLNRAIPWLVGLYLFSNPFPHVTAISEIGFYLSLVLATVLSFIRRGRFSLRTPLSVPFALFFLWCCLGLVFSLNRANSMHDIYAHLMKYMVFFYLIVNFFNSRKGFLALVWIVVISTGVYIIALMGYSYAILGHELNELLGSDIPETSPNILALVTLFGFLISIFLVSRENSLRKNVLLIFSQGILLFAILATQSRSALLALAAALVAVFPRRKKTFISLIAVAAIVTTGVIALGGRQYTGALLSKIRSGDRSTMKERVGMWMCYAHIIKDHPLTGVGFGMQTCYDEKLLLEYNQRVSEKYRVAHLYGAPHNLIIDTATRTGLVGAALFLYLLFVFLRMGWRIARRGRDAFTREWSFGLMGTFTAVFIQGMFENTLSGPPAVILYLILAMMTILWRMENERKTSISSSAVMEK
jgi:O-antigen ligase